MLLRPALLGRLVSILPWTPPLGDEQPFTEWPATGCIKSYTSRAQSLLIQVARPQPHASTGEPVGMTMVFPPAVATYANLWKSTNHRRKSTYANLWKSTYAQGGDVIKQTQTNKLVHTSM